MWIGLGLAYFSMYPPGFFIAVVSFAGYLLARFAAAVWRAAGRGETLALAPAALPRGPIA